MSLRDDLLARRDRLQAHKVELVKRHGKELAAVNQQLAGLAALVAQWDTFTVDEALAAVATAGLKIRVDG